MSGGGQQNPRDVMNYNPPKGPTNINDSKSPGIHGNNYDNCGTQQRSSVTAEESGSPGLHGDNHGTGTNRG